MKRLALAIGTYNALLWRTLAGALVGAAFFFGTRNAWPGPAAMRVHLTRGLLSVPMALFFFWGLARVPMAQAIALAFVAPLIALYLAAILLKERIERARSSPPCSALPACSSSSPARPRPISGPTPSAARSPSSARPGSTPRTSS